MVPHLSGTGSVVPNLVQMLLEEAVCKSWMIAKTSGGSPNACNTLSKQ